MNTDEHGSEINTKFFRSVFICVHLWLFSCFAQAHPLPNMRFDRTVDVHLSRDGVTVLYVLELTDWTMVLDGKNLVTPADVRNSPGQLGYARVYGAKKAPLIADDLRATLDGNDVPFNVETIGVEPESDHVRLRLQFRAAWAPEAGKPHRFAFEDQNFEDRSGAVALTLTADDGVELNAVNEPGELRGKSPLDLTPAEATRLRKASATFTLVGRVESSRPASGAIAGLEDSTRPTEAKETPSVTRGLADRGLTSLFDTGYGLGVLLLLAFGFGAAHAFTPGHGKTLVAAYLVGERGTVRHAVVLGLTTTLAHTGSVIIVAAILWATYGDAIPATTEAVLQVAGGGLIFGVGTWLFLQRVRGRADHIHLFGDHHHHAPKEGTKTPFGWTRIILLGLGGGIIPCGDAILLLVVAASAGRLGVAVPLLFAFSAGLAAVLVGLGVGVVFAHRAGGRAFGEARWFQALPVVSAVLLVGLGAWFIRDGARALLGL